VYMTMPIASIIAPFIGGQIADRWFATQRFLAVSQLAGGILLFVVARLTGRVEVFVVMLLYTLLYAPTIALTNSMVFHHWPTSSSARSACGARSAGSSSAGCSPSGGARRRAG